MSEAFICGTCGRRVRNPYEQFTKSEEYRRLDGKERRLRITLAHICRDCVDARRAEHEGGPKLETGALFDLDNLGWEPEQPKRSGDLSVS